MTLATTALHAGIRGATTALNRRVVVKLLKKQLVRMGICSQDLADTKGATIVLELLLPVLLAGGSKILPSGENLDSVKGFVGEQAGKLLQGIAEREAIEFAGKVLPAILENGMEFMLQPHRKMEALEEGMDD
jgi:hypothetical protein